MMIMDDGCNASHIKKNKFVQRGEIWEIIVEG